MGEEAGQNTNCSSVHLVVLQHGLWGNAQNLAELERMLRSQAGPNVEVLNSKVNEHGKAFLTYDGVDQCGLRLAAEVVREVNSLTSSGHTVTHISFVGYSLGGLITRYACGMLHAAGWLQPGSLSPKNQETGSQTPSSKSPNLASKQGAQINPQTFACDCVSGGDAGTGTTKHTSTCAHQAQTEHTSTSTSTFTHTSTSTNQAHIKQTSTIPSLAPPGEGAPLALPPCPRPLEPVVFVTIATPHLGSWRLPTSVMSRCFNSMVTSLASKSGAQLMLADTDHHNRPLLINMCDPSLPFHRALSAFRRRALLANVYNDRMVPWCTAAIETENFFEACCPEPISPEYPSVVYLPKQSGSRPQANLHAFPPNGSDPVRELAATQNQLPEQPSNQPRRAPRRFRGLGTRVGVVTVLLVLLPISLPLILWLMLYLWITGKRHAAKAFRVGPDHSWLGAGHHHRPQHLQKQEQQQEQQPRVASSFASLAAQPEEAALPCPGQDFSAPHITLVRDAPSATSRAGRAGQPCYGREAIGSGDVDVLFEDNTQMHIHEGLVEDSPSGAAHRQHLQQLWMAKQLNSLGWEKIAIDTRHYHAHAAIVLRDPSRFRANADCVQYLLDKVLLPAF